MKALVPMATSRDEFPQKTCATVVFSTLAHMSMMTLQCPMGDRDSR